MGTRRRMVLASFGSDAASRIWRVTASILRLRTEQVLNVQRPGGIGHMLSRMHLLRGSLAGRLAAADLGAAAVLDGLQLPDQALPVDAMRVADDVDARNARALDDVVAAALRRLDAVHETDFVRKLAAQSQPVVVEVLEEPQEAARERRCDTTSAAATADARQVLDRPLADQVLRVVLGGGAKARIEAHRRPAEQLEIADIPVQPAGDGAERKRAGDRLEIEIPHARVRPEARIGAERIAQLQAIDDHATAEHRGFQVADEGQHLVLERHARDATPE